MELESIAFENEDNIYSLNKTKMCNGILDHLSNHDIIQSRMNFSFAIQIFVPNPLYLSFTYFGGSIEKRNSYLNIRDPYVFKNEIINGYCVSLDSDSSYFIYDYEFR